MSVYRLYANGAVDTSVSVDIRADGEITGIAMGAAILALTTAEMNAVRGEVSFGSTTTLSTNDARQSLLSVDAAAYYDASAGPNGLPLQDHASPCSPGLPSCSGRSGSAGRPTSSKERMAAA